MLVQTPETVGRLAHRCQEQIMTTSEMGEGVATPLRTRLDRIFLAVLEHNTEVWDAGGWLPAHLC